MLAELDWGGMLIYFIVHGGDQGQFRKGHDDLIGTGRGEFCFPEIGSLYRGASLISLACLSESQLYAELRAGWMKSVIAGSLNWAYTRFSPQGLSERGHNLYWYHTDVQHDF